MKRRSARNERKPKPTRAAQRQPLSDQTAQADPPQPEKTVVIAGEPVTAREVLASLIDSRGLVSPFDRALSLACTNAICTGDLASAVKALTFLPPPRAVAPPGSTHGAAGYREAVMRLIMSSILADRQELAARAERGEQLSEADELRLRLARLEETETPDERAERGELSEAERDDAAGVAAEASALQEAEAKIVTLQDEILHLRGVKPRQLPPPNAKAVAPVAKPADPVKSAAPPKPPNAPPYDPIVNGLAQPPKSDAEIKAQMDRANARSIPPSVMRTNPGSEPWRDYVSPTGEISMRPRGNRWGPI